MPRIIECDLYNSRKFTRNHVCDLRNVGRVPHRVRDVPVPQVLLDRSRVVALIGELEAAGVA
jgi:hypothetical protein